jgi:hypothetical protein
MTKAQAEKIVRALEEEGIDASIREDYSGRCMYGATCVAIVCDDPVAVGFAAGKARIPSKDRPKRQDNMGRSMVLY